MNPESPAPWGASRPPPRPSPEAGSQGGQIDAPWLVQACLPLRARLGHRSPRTRGLVPRQTISGRHPTGRGTGRADRRTLPCSGLFTFAGSAWPPKSEDARPGAPPDHLRPTPPKGRVTGRAGRRHPALFRLVYLWRRPGLAAEVPGREAWCPSRPSQADAPKGRVTGRAARRHPGLFRLVYLWRARLAP